ncbi:MAG: DnaD domain protein [Finegoldia sp.]|nr:DnaD domain protein [Finegoldia sp.]
MKYSLENFKIDIGETSIENIFLNQYLAIANGNQLKVYLYAFKIANDTSLSKPELTDAQLAKSLGLTEAEVIEAWNFWLEEGVVKRYTDPTDNSNHTVFLSLRQLYLGITDPDMEDSETTYIPENSQEISQMFRDIEDIRDEELSKSEMERILDHINDTHQTPELVVTAFHYCATTKGKKNTNYVLQVLRNWKVDGILTFEQWQEENNRKEEKKKRQKVKKRKYYKPSENDIDKNARDINSKLIDSFMKDEDE